MKTVIKSLLYVWQLPQNLLGLILLLFYKREMFFKIINITPEVYVTKAVTIAGGKKCKYVNPTIHICPGMRGGISLGNTVIIGQYNLATLYHEIGHCFQSLYLGWFYLIVIGVPTIWNYMIDSISETNIAGKYFTRFPETWADKLGGVLRN